MAYLIKDEKCLGCGACSFACPFCIPVPTDDTRKKYIIGNECNGCGQCTDICPVNAIVAAPGHITIKKVEILTDKCNGDDKCLNSCPAHAITNINGKCVINHEMCFCCGTCVKSCEKGAIILFC